ncbi:MULTISPECIES: complex I 24 kDa subunit family protein [Herpetosiphon]|uniref:complex I 24 kDa subunit family protein n=1 Tax=Herpetosiphon TaxID=64 RepID=UPI000B1A2D39|nr:NAD(P)H-dependent oxidoreductase subunit E [Herpetosiphon geysericola]MBM7842506.1 NADH-quinone oxidoreductase subunit E [Herpetosiphon giganteus]
MLYEQHKAEIDGILARYPVDRKRSALLPLLYLAQDVYGRLNRDSIREVAEILDLPYTDVFEVVGFYTLFYNEDVGKIVLDVCDDVPCCFCGAEELVADLENRLGIKAGETTKDKVFTLRRVKCIAACDQAPVLQANLEFHNRVLPDKVEAMLTKLRNDVEAGKPVSISGRLAER